MGADSPVSCQSGAMLKRLALGTCGLFLFAGGAAAALGSTGCFGCTAVLASSVDLKITDALATCPGNVKIVSQHDDDPPETFDCELRDFQGECACRTSLGEEETGTFVVKVTSADGKRAGSGEVDVGGDFCHVETEQLTISLK
jgi:hypothetical protein